METIISIYNLPLPMEICERVAKITKHDPLEPKYKRSFNELNKQTSFLVRA